MEMGAQISFMSDTINTKIGMAELNTALVSKADISEISKTVTEVVESLDCTTKLEEMKKLLDKKIGKHDYNQQIKTFNSIIDEVKKSNQNFSTAYGEIKSDVEGFREKLEGGKKDSNKKLT